MSLVSVKFAESHIMKVPPMGDSIAEGTVLSWMKKEGDLISNGEPVCVIETDKVLGSHNVIRFNSRTVFLRLASISTVMLPV